MLRGISIGLLSVLMIGMMVVCAPVFAGGAWKTVELAAQGEPMEVLLPAGTSYSEARGSLSVERFPVIDRELSDGSSVRSLPVIFTFVNHWNECWIFEAYSEAALTDLAGNRLLPSVVVRDAQVIDAGISTLIPQGRVVELTLFYDLDAAYDESALSELRLDVSYLNHGHPYQVSAIISAYSANALLSPMVNVTDMAGGEEAPNVVQVNDTPPPAPAPVAPPPAPAPEPVQPTPVVKEEAPTPPPAPVAPPPAPAPVPAPPAPAPEPVAPAPAPVAPVSAPCAPCAPCFPPICIAIPVPNLCGLACCVLNETGKGVCCTTNVIGTGVCNGLQQTCCFAGGVLNGAVGLVGCVGKTVCNTVGCVFNAVLNPICNLNLGCAPCGPCGPTM